MNSPFRALPLIEVQLSYTSDRNMLSLVYHDHIVLSCSASLVKQLHNLHMLNFALLDLVYYF